MTRKVVYNDRIQEAENGAAAADGAVAAPSAPCECETPNVCSHVLAFRKLKSLGNIDGIGKKMLQKLTAHLTI